MLIPSVLHGTANAGSLSEQLLKPFTSLGDSEGHPPPQWNNVFLTEPSVKRPETVTVPVPLCSKKKEGGWNQSILMADR